MTSQLLEPTKQDRQINELYFSINYFTTHYKTYLSELERETLKELCFELSKLADNTNLKPYVLLPSAITDILCFYPYEASERMIQLLEYAVIIFEEKITKLFYADNGKIFYYDWI